MTNGFIKGQIFNWLPKSIPTGEPKSACDALRLQRNIDPAAKYDIELDPLFALIEEMAPRVAALVQPDTRAFINSDYDVDGIVSGLVWKRLISFLGGSCQLFIPNRFRDSYGVNFERIRLEHSKNAFDLLVCLDRGATVGDELSLLAHELKIEVLVIEHHTPKLVSAKRDLVCEINPHNFPGIDPLEYCSAVISVLMYEAVIDYCGGNDLGARCELRVLAGLAVFADVVSVKGLTARAVARFALDHALDPESNPGLRSLIRQRCDTSFGLTSGDMCFRICPVLNAAGRLESADLAIELLSTRCQGEHQALVRRLIELNAKRQTLQAEIEAQARKRAGDGANVLLEFGPWHHGVVGPAAGRLSEQLGIPVMLGGPDANLKAYAFSGRSRCGTDLISTLDRASAGLNIQYGGHKSAVGARVSFDRAEAVIAELRSRLLAACPGRVERQTRWFDLALRPGSVAIETLNTLRSLEPFGPENETPIFLVPGVHLRQAESSRSPGDASGIALFRCPLGQEHRFATAVYNHPALAGSRDEPCALIGSLMHEAFEGRSFVRFKIEDIVTESDARA